MTTCPHQKGTDPSVTEPAPTSALALASLHCVLPADPRCLPVAGNRSHLAVGTATPGAWMTSPNPVTAAPSGLWPHQQRAVQAAAHLARPERCQAIMACQDQETRTGAETSRHVAAAGKVLVVAPTRELPAQTAWVCAGHLGASAGTTGAVCAEPGELPFGVRWATRTRARQHHARTAACRARRDPASRAPRASPPLTIFALPPSHGNGYHHR